VIVPLFVTEVGSDAIIELLSSADDDRFVSTLAAAEVASALSRRVRKNEIDPEEADLWLALFDEWLASDPIKLAVDDRDIHRAGQIVRRYDTKLLTPDAIHLATCRRHGHVLVTLDKRLAMAAEMIGVTAIVP
jgi:uncharacterized protein